ncbi:MAG: ACT domain-containing protein [Phycisphaerales bacterium]|nr:ACT domain-containing protein [Phycisphaerales bacterium]
MTMPPLALEWLSDGREYAIARLDPDATIPAWASDARPGIVAITRTPDELAIILPAARLPEPRPIASLGWVGLRVVGTLDFGLVGILASLTGALAGASVSVCAVSTFDTDLLFVRHADVGRAVEALSSVADVGRLRGSGPGGG